MISRRVLIQHSITAGALAGLAAAAVQCQPIEAPAAERDPLLELIIAYRDAMARYDASSDLTDDEDDALADATFRPLYGRLRECPPAATTLAGALAGIQLVIQEEADCGGQPELTVGVLRSVLAFFDGRAV